MASTRLNKIVSNNNMNRWNDSMMKQHGESEGVPEVVKQEARYLARDIVLYISGNNSAKPRNGPDRTLRRVVDEMLEKHSVLFRSMVNKLHITEDTGYCTFVNVISELFADGQRNWGRIVTVYAFAGMVAKYCRENNMVHCLDQIATYAGNFVAETLCTWIHGNGGWDAFEAYFPDPLETENVVWKGLLFTVAGLGALATASIVAAR